MIDLHFLPLGDVKKERIESVKLAVEIELKVNIQLVEREILPRQFHNNLRKQYSAAHILNHLVQKHMFSSIKIVAFMKEDLYLLPLDYILAVTDSTQHVALISTARLKDMDRIIKATLHEIGHLFGLEHCETEDCIMFPTQGDVKLIDKKKHFCQKHRI